MAWQVLIHLIMETSIGGTDPDPKVYAYLISKGINGFFCDISMIRPWLESSRLDFELVIKTNSLQYGLTNRYAE
jgi:hypothetical protein